MIKASGIILKRVQIISQKMKSASKWPNDLVHLLCVGLDIKLQAVAVLPLIMTLLFILFLTIYSLHVSRYTINHPDLNPPSQISATEDEPARTASHCPKTSTLPHIDSPDAEPPHKFAYNPKPSAVAPPGELVCVIAGH